MKIDIDDANLYLSEESPWLLRKNEIDGRFKLYKKGDIIELIAIDEKKKILFSFDVLIVKVSRGLKLGLDEGWCILTLEPIEHKYFVEIKGTDLQRAKINRDYKHIRYVS